MSVIAELIRAGVDPELVAKVADELESARVECPHRSAGALRQERYRRNKASQSDVTRDVTSDAAPPPDGSPNEYISNPSFPSPQNKPTKRVRARTLIPADASPEPAQLDFAYSSGLNDQQVRAEWEQFRDHHRSRGNLMLDWHSAWRTWVRNCNKYKARAGPYNTGRSNGSAELTRWVLEGIEDDKRRSQESGSTVVPMLPVNRGCY